MIFVNSLIMSLTAANLPILQASLTVALIIFLIYSGIFLGATLFAFHFGNKAKKTGNSIYMSMVADYINLPLSRFYLALLFWLTPFLVIYFIYSGFFPEENNLIIKLIVFSSGFYLLGISFLLSYRYVLFTRDIYSKENIDKKETSELASIESTLVGPGMLMIFISMWMFVATLSLTLDAGSWGSKSGIFDVMFSSHAIVNFLKYLAASLSVAGITFYFKVILMKRRSNNTQEYVDFAAKHSLSVALVFASVLPLFYFLDLVLTHKETVSVIPFVLLLVAIITIFIAIHLLYVNYKDSSVNYAKWALYLLVFVFTLQIISEQISFETAAKEHLYLLTKENEKQK